LNRLQRFLNKKKISEKIICERKRKLTEENVLQPFFLLFSLKKKDFKQISSKGRDGPRGRVKCRTELNSTITVKTFLFSVRFDALTEKRLQ